ncbi:MAG: TetR/AcrR family transcriptional regulator [Bdellovibrionota bacterium]
MIQDKAKGYQKIMEAAMDCVVTLGPEKTTLRAIAKKAGISVGLVHYHVPKKKDLFYLVLKYFLEETQLSIAKPDLSLRGIDLFLERIRYNFEIFHPSNAKYYQCFLLGYYYATFRREFHKLMLKHRILVMEKDEQNIKDILQEFKIYRTPEEIRRFIESSTQFLAGAMLLGMSVYSKAEYERIVEHQTELQRLRLLAFLGQEPRVV